MSTNIRLSGSNPGDPREESDIRFNYANLKQIVCASTKLGGNQPIHYSGDGGASWSQSQLPTAAPADVRQGDPTIDWTSDGTAWSVTIGLGISTLILRCFKSSDGGATWTFDSTIPGGQTNMDKEALWVDHSPTSPFRDNLYLIWHNGGPCYVSRRQGPGGAWHPPLGVSGAETTGTAIGGDIKSNANGDVFAFWPDTGSRNLFAAKSIDGGVSFGAPVSIATTFAAYDIGVPAQDDRGVLIYLSGGAYRAASLNMVYACWTDLAGGPGCNASFDQPGSSVASPCKSRIWFSRSTDGGGTWEPARKLNDQSALNDQIFPRLAVDETNGVLMVVYYDTIKDPGRLKTDLWTQWSSDNGVSWTSPVQVTTSETNETSAGAELNFQYGDYIGLTGNAGNFFACWTDRRSAGAEEIWGAALTATSLVTAIADSGNFGNVCVGSFADELLTINNTGPGPLLIFTIISSSPDFEPPGVASYPLLVNSGSSIDVVIRFQPSGIGPKSATLTIVSSDPTTHKVNVTGNAPAPRLSLLIANAGNFGKACAGAFVDEPLILNNSGTCMLSVTGISSSSAEFVVPQVLWYPLSVAPGNFLPVPIRFAPSSFGPQSATLTVDSNDPAGARTIGVSGDVPSGKIVVTGSTHFGGVKACCYAERTISICNTGECSLHVTSVRFKRKSRYWKLIHNPFPATLRAGSCLCLGIRYKAAQRVAWVCELVIESDDPATPVKTVELIAYTIWGGCGCKKCCDDCRKGCCNKTHTECCCRERQDVCCDDDDEDDGDDE